MISQIETAAPNYPLVEVFRSETTLANVLGEPLDDPLGLYDAPAEISEFDTPSTTLHTIFLPETPLYGASLIDLLSAVAPAGRTLVHNEDSYDFSRHYTITRGPTLDDWRVVSSEEKEDRKLASAHAKSTSLRENWEEFVGLHLPALIQAISAVSERETANYFNGRLDRFITREAALADIHTALRETSTMHPSPKDFYGWKMGSFINQTIDIINADLSTSGVSLSDFPVLNTPPSFHELLDRLSPETLTRFVDGLDVPSNNIFRSMRVVVSPDYPTGRLYPSWQPEDENSHYVEHIGNGILVAHAEDSTATFRIDGERVVEEGRDIKPQKDKGIYPLLAWEKAKSTGQRTFITNPVDLHEMTPRGDANLLAGLLTAFYLSPDAQARLPIELGFKPGGKMQEMREAQIPLLALMSKALLDNSALMPAIEALAA